MATQVVTDSLIHRWEAADYTANSTTWVDQIGSKKLTFGTAPSSKTDDGVELTTSNTFTSEALTAVTYPATFEWIGRIDGNWNNSTPGNVFGWSNSNGLWGGICCYSKTSSNGIQLDIASSGSITSKVYTTGAHHIVLTITSSTTTLYVDSTTSKGTSSNSAARISKKYLYNSEGSGRFYGAISAMRIWNKCLSSSEIETLFTEEAAEDVGYVKVNGVWTQAKSVYVKESTGWTASSWDDLQTIFKTDKIKISS